MKQPEHFEVTVVRGENQERLTVRAGDNLLMAMMRAGLPVEFSCTTGKCTTCRLRMDIPDGSAMQPGETERYRLGEAALAAGYRLSCQLYVSDPLTVHLPDP
jgi:ferredoxin